jgi:lysozyme
VITFGLDISHHQDKSLDPTACARDGIQFAFLKASQGAGFTDPEFAANLKKWRGAGTLMAAYHYMTTESPILQAHHVADVVPPSVAVIPDVEAAGVTLTAVRQFVSELRRLDYLVPLTYLPRWYWQRLGSPSLVGLPPLWSSRYPDNVVGTLPDEWADVPEHYWDGYGGLPVAVLQFTSSASIGGHAPLDANAFRGTRTELAAQLGYHTQGDDLVKNLILAGEDKSDRIWVGDGIHRRHVEDPTELAGLQYWIGMRGGDPTIQRGWQDLRVLGIDVTEVPNPAPSGE